MAGTTALYLIGLINNTLLHRVLNEAVITADAI
jgi:hypothetical protein